MADLFGMVAVVAVLMLVFGAAWWTVSADGGDDSGCGSCEDGWCDPRKCKYGDRDLDTEDPHYWS